VLAWQNRTQSRFAFFSMQAGWNVDAKQKMEHGDSLVTAKYVAMVTAAMATKQGAMAVQGPKDSSNFCIQGCIASAPACLCCACFSLSLSLRAGWLMGLPFQGWECGGMPAQSWRVAPLGEARRPTRTTRHQPMPFCSAPAAVRVWPV
jgi:hypothetical protein